jgi:phosphatidylglycerophosphate synthase
MQAIDARHAPHRLYEKPRHGVDVLDPEPEKMTVRLDLIGDNPTLLWGMTNAERVRRMARENGYAVGPGAGDAVRVDLNYAFDPAWLRHIAARPGSSLALGGIPVLSHGSGGEVFAAEDEHGILNEALRKRERPFVIPLTPANVPAIERASYVGAYKGVTDVLTKYLWPEWAFHLTRLAARTGATPNMVTALGTLLCIAATVAFWYGWFWSGLAMGLVFMVLDTVDGKLARCTITSSAIGNAWDHGIDLVHPPFWWWAWGVGCAAYGRALSDEIFWAMIATMLVGYVLQRLIEGAFIVRFGMHIHVWQKFDSDFRLVTARRNPNMVILFAGLLIGRPDWGIVAVAAWTAISLVVHLVRLLQAMAAPKPLVSWLA